MSRAVTCVTGAARDETAAPHDGRGVHVHASVDAVAAVGVADRWVAAPIVRCVVRAVAAAVVAHDGDPWPPGCSWSGCPVRGSAAASDSWDKRFADATRSLQGGKVSQMIAQSIAAVTAYLAARSAAAAIARDPRASRMHRSPGDVAAV